MTEEFPRLDRREIALHRAEFWADKRKNALMLEMREAQRTGNPIAYFSARDRLAEAFPAPV